MKLGKGREKREDRRDDHVTSGMTNQSSFSEACVFSALLTWLSFSSQSFRTVWTRLWIIVLRYCSRLARLSCIRICIYLRRPNEGLKCQSTLHRPLRAQPVSINNFFKYMVFSSFFFCNGISLWSVGFVRFYVTLDEASTRQWERALSSLLQRN